MKRLLSIVSVLFLVAAPSGQAQEKQSPSSSKEFPSIAPELDPKEGASIVFLGDSITHQCLYTQYVEDFFYTRYPNRRIHFHNAGVSGDRAADALARFEADVAKFKPDYVTILLGMNDGSYTDFKQEIFDTYAKGMTKLLGRIGEIDATAIPMTPTMFDARAARIAGRANEPRDTYYNSVLAFYGEWLREQAFTRGLGFVDMHSPLNNITTEQRQKDPQFTVIKDAVHPGPDGQLIMAAAILEDMVPSSPVSVIALRRNPDGQFKAKAQNGELSNLQTSDDKVAFTFKANSLPWIVPEEAALGFKLAKAGRKFSRERLAIASLLPGRYELLIDGQAVGSYEAADLAQGIDLQGNPKTPQYQQALAVANLNKKRNDEAVRPLRNQWGQRKGKRGDERWLAENANSPEAPAKRKSLDEWLAKFESEVERLHALAREYEDQIYKANQPKAYQYLIRRLP